MVGREWPKDNCTNSLLAERRQSLSRDAIVTAAGFTSQSKTVPTGDANGYSCTVRAAPAEAERAWVWPGQGKSREGLSLAQARLKAADARKELAEGKDPAAERRAEAVAGTTFGAVR